MRFRRRYGEKGAKSSEVGRPERSFKAVIVCHVNPEKESFLADYVPQRALREAEDPDLYSYWDIDPLSQWLGCGGLFHPSMTG
jgi:hypothetical protein